MPRETTRRYNPESGQEETTHIGAGVDSGSLADRAATAAKGTTAGKGLGAMAKGGAGMPKQAPGESPAEFSERIRKWREKRNDTMSSMQSKMEGQR